MSEFLDELFGEGSDDEDVFGKDDPTPVEQRSGSEPFENPNSDFSLPILQKRKKKKKKKKNQSDVESQQQQQKKIVFIERPQPKKKKTKKTKKQLPQAPRPVKFLLPVKKSNKLQFTPIYPPNEDIDIRVRYPALALRPFSSYLVIHGGIGQDRQRKNDLYRIELRESRWKNVNDHFKKYPSKLVPSINFRHHIFFLSHYLLCAMSCSHSCFVLHGWDSFKKNDPRDEKWREKQLYKVMFWKKCPVERSTSRRNASSTEKHLPTLTGYSVISHRSESMFLFGKSTSDNEYNTQAYNVYPIGGRRHSMDRRSIERFSFSRISTRSNSAKPVPRTDAAICHSRKFVFTFGGISKDGEVLNDLWRFEFVGKNDTVMITGGIRWQRMEHFNGPYRPPALFGATMKLTREQMNDEHLIVFGGHTNKNRMEPEKFMYRYHDRKWTAVMPFRNGHIEGMAEMTHVQKGVNESYLLGGITTSSIANKELENCLLECKGWAGKDEELELFQFLNEQRKKKEYVDLKLITFSEIKKGAEDDDDEEEEDGEDGEKEKEKKFKKREIWVHKCILYARCPYFKKLLTEKPDLDELEVFQLGIPHEIVKSYITFLYTGNVILSSPKCVIDHYSAKNNYDIVRKVVHEKSEMLLQLCQAWGHFETIQKIVNFDPEIFCLKFSHQLLERMKLDFRSLLNKPQILKGEEEEEEEEEMDSFLPPEIPKLHDDDDEEEEEEEEENEGEDDDEEEEEEKKGKGGYKKSSDIVLEGKGIQKEMKKNENQTNINNNNNNNNINEEFQDLRVFCTPPQSDGYLFHCHKVFLIRSTFVYRCLHSGMVEEIESKLMFNNLSVEGLRAVLEYFYTDQIPVIDNQTAIEIHIFAGLFKLTRIADICRNVILKWIEEDNVIDLINIFDVYQDSMILDECVRFMMKDMEKYEEEYKFHPGLENITQETRARILKVYIKMKSRKN